MTATTSFSVFHQWLLAEPATLASACAIVLHVSPSLPGASLIEGIAEYLNEYDDDGDGSWLPATSELIAKVSADENYRQLLGIPENEPAGAAGQLQTLAALGQRGRVVFQSPDASEPDLGGIKSFRAGIGSAPNDFKDCHLVLNPDLIDQKSIAHIVGDVFLEWLHCDFRRGSALHQIE